MSRRRQRTISPPWEHNWTDRVDSVDEHLGFVAHIHLAVHLDPVHPADPASLPSTDDGAPAVVPPAVSRAAMWARSQVEKVTQDWGVLHRHAAQHDLNDRLSRGVPHTVDGGVVGSLTAVLSVATDDTRAAHALQEARREAYLDELARRQTAANLRFLREECFDNPASARLFLMLNTTSRLGVFPNAQQADDVVTEVTRWHSDSLWVQVAKTLQTALVSLTPEQADELLRVLSAVLSSTGHPDQARTLHDLRSRVNRGSRNGHDESL